MKIGDKVRFLSDTGGGKIAGFQGKSVVLVEDSDGFQIPTPVSEVVVVDEDNYTTGFSDVSASAVMNDDEDYDPADRPVTFKAKPMEYKGGDKLSVYLAFVPVNIREMSKTSFETYLINDSNYYISFAYMSQTSDGWTLRAMGEIEPNTKEYVEKFGFDTLGDMEHVAIQCVAYKRDKSFTMKPAVDVRLRIDAVKFYKRHSFRENDFFDEDAMVYTVMENDVAAHPLVIDTKKIETEMMKTARREDVPRGHDMTARKKAKDDIVVVDLHAAELLETTAGMSSGDILNYQLDVFRKTLEKHRMEKGKRIVFIHGKGEGVLRSAIVKELRYKYKNYPFQDASFREYGYGATQVTIK